MSLADESVVDLVRRTTSGEVTARAVLEDCLARIAERDPALNAFAVVLADQARAEADRLDAARAAGEPLGALHGVPVAIKDELDVAGTVTGFGGRGNSTPAAADCALVRRLRDAGAVVIGRTRMPEFGQWPFTESVAGGITRNPWDRSRTPGGSSGGTAVAVAAGMVPVGIGGDGGGSIRIPAACTGLFGLKPERGRVSAAPHQHLWWALGTMGPLTRTVADSALVYDVIRGSEEIDLFAAKAPRRSFAAAAAAVPGTLRVGWSTRPVTPGVKVDPAHVRVVEQTAELLAGLGHQVREIDPGYPNPVLPFTLQFLAGVRSEAAEVEHYGRLERRTRETVRLGSFVRRPVRDFALRQGDRVSSKVETIFEDCDVLLTPVIAERPRTVGALSRGGTLTATMRAMPMVAFTALWNLTGHPAASVPAGVAADGLPLAVQLVGRRGDEDTLLSLAAQLETARPWPLTADLG